VWIRQSHHYGIFTRAGAGAERSAIRASNVSLISSLQENTPSTVQGPATGLIILTIGLLIGRGRIRKKSRTRSSQNRVWRTHKRIVDTRHANRSRSSLHVSHDGDTAGSSLHCSCSVSCLFVTTGEGPSTTLSVNKASHTLAPEKIGRGNISNQSTTARPF
jgi:hypothetical protein